MNGLNLLNAVLFQGAWFACVLGGAVGSSVWGAAAVLVLGAFTALRDHWRTDLALALIAAAVGFGLDTLWIRAGVLDYGGVAFAPAWIVLLWLGVGLTLNHSLSLFASRPWLGGLLAGLGAPLSYLGGERLGAVVVVDPWLLPLISLTWFLVFTAAFLQVRALAVTNVALSAGGR